MTRIFFFPPSCFALALLVPLLARAQNPARVTVAEVKEEKLVEELGLTGSVTPERRALLSPRTSGLVAKMHVDAGDHVKAGQPLMELDSALAEVAVQRARNALAEAQARLAEAQRLAEEGDQLVQSRTLPRTEALARQAAVRVAAAAVNQLQADVREREEILNRHLLPAPFDGVVSRKGTELGEWVETGTMVFELVETDRLRLDVQAPQEWFHAIRENGGAMVRLDGVADEPLRARVRAKVPVQDAVARTFLLLLDVEDPQGLMGPGMSASVDFTVPAGRAGLVVPRDALVRLPDGSVKVWVVGDDTTAQPRSVTLGRASGPFVEILKGVDAGDRVVVRGNESLRTGQPLDILPAESAALSVN